MTATEYAAFDARLTRLETIAAVLKEFPRCRTSLDLDRTQRLLADAVVQPKPVVLLLPEKRERV